MNRDEIKEKFEGFFAPDSSPLMTREVEKVTKPGSNPVNTWIPSRGRSGLVLRTTLDSDGQIGFVTEALLEGNWNDHLKVVSANLVFRPVGDKLQLKNINKGISKIPFDTGSGWHITDWLLVVIDKDSGEIQEELKETDLICAVIHWRDKDGNEMETNYGWKAYR